MCSDWSIYEEIFHHLFSNSIKHSPSNTRISVRLIFNCREQKQKRADEMNYREVRSNNTPFTGYLSTVISDHGFGLNNPQIKSRPSMNSTSKDSFSNYQRQKKESGVGLGITTAKTLAQALGGLVRFSSKQERNDSGTTVCFNVALTSAQYAKGYQTNINNIGQLVDSEDMQNIDSLLKCNSF